MEATSGVAHTIVPTPVAQGTVSPQVWLHAAIRFSQAMSFPLKGVFKSRVKGRVWGRGVCGQYG